MCVSDGTCVLKFAKESNVLKWCIRYVLMIVGHVLGLMYLMSAKCQCLTRQVALLGNEPLSSFHVIESSMSTCVCHIGGEYL